MAQSSSNIGHSTSRGHAALDPIWNQVRAEAELIVEREPVMAGFILEGVLNQPSLETAVASRISERLRVAGLSPEMIRQLFVEMARSTAEDGNSQWSSVLRADLAAVFDRDPACDRYLEALLYFKGFHALQSHRLAHWLWHNGRRDLALFMQSCTSSAFQVDIHPAVAMGRGIFMDHATGIVIGSTARLGDDVSILQGVTLGGTGKEDGDRHPKVSNGVLIGAGAQVLGNIKIGHCSRVAAGSVVLKDIPPMKTVAGVPAKIVGESGCSQPSRSMNQMVLPGESD
jgi:serine O-acetyltransferase